MYISPSSRLSLSYQHDRQASRWRPTGTNRSRRQRGTYWAGSRVADAVAAAAAKPRASNEPGAVAPRARCQHLHYRCCYHHRRSRKVVARNRVADAVAAVAVAAYVVAAAAATFGWSSDETEDWQQGDPDFRRVAADAAPAQQPRQCDGLCRCCCRVACRLRSDSWWAHLPYSWDPWTCAGCLGCK